VNNTDTVKNMERTWTWTIPHLSIYIFFFILQCAKIDSSCTLFLPYFCEIFILPFLLQFHVYLFIFHPFSFSVSFFLFLLIFPSRKMT
jgi:hypothetical protein